MGNIYRINFKQLRQENLKEVFASFERALQVFDIDFYLIGAIARDTWFAQKGIRALGTKDVDFAVMVSNPEIFSELKQYLVSKEAFTESSTNDYALFDKKGFQIDLLPFGSLEIEGRKIIDMEGLVRTDISGFKEVYEEATQDVRFDNKYNFKVSTLAGIVLLKFISYHDRPEMRGQDIKDIAGILSHYFELEAETIYENHANLFTAENEDLNRIAARVLGRQMQKVLNKNELLKARIVSLLQENTVSPAGSTIAQLMQSGIDTIEKQVELLKEILKGATEKYE